MKKTSINQETPETLATFESRVAVAQAIATLQQLELDKAAVRSLSKILGGVRSRNREAKLVMVRAKEQEALEHIQGEKTWSVTECQDVVPCSAVITDPPQAVTKEPWEPEDLEAFTREWAVRWNQCGADIICISWSQLFLFEGKQWFDESFSNYQFEQLLVWHYRNDTCPQPRVRFKRSWEPILFYRKRGSDRKIGIGNPESGGDTHDFDCHVAAVPTPRYTGSEFKQHPTQKPISVMRWLVAATTVAGEVVADPFCGSGTTGVACMQLGRRFHGIEVSTEFRELAERRIGAYGGERNGEGPRG